MQKYTRSLTRKKSSSNQNRDASRNPVDLHAPKVPDPALSRDSLPESASTPILTIETAHVTSDLARVTSHVSPEAAPEAVPEAAPVAFEKFNDLPRELQVKIWNFCIPGERVVEVLCREPANGKFHTDCKVPVVLHICHNSRHEALKIYKKFVVENKVTEGVEDETGLDDGTSAGDTGVEPDYVKEKRAIKPFATYIDCHRDMLYMSLGGATNSGRRYSNDATEFLSRIDAETAKQIQRLSFDTPNHPFNDIFDVLATRFSTLRVCAVVATDICMSYWVRGGSAKYSAAPHHLAIGFKETDDESLATMKRWDLKLGCAMPKVSRLTWEVFHQRMDKVKINAVLGGWDRKWVYGLRLIPVDIMREGE